MITIYPKSSSRDSIQIRVLLLRLYSLVMRKRAVERNAGCVGGVAMADTLVHTDDWEWEREWEGQ